MDIYQTEDELDKAYDRLDTMEHDPQFTPSPIAYELMYLESTYLTRKIELLKAHQRELRALQPK